MAVVLLEPNLGSGHNSQVSPEPPAQGQCSGEFLTQRVRFNYLILLTEASQRTPTNAMGFSLPANLLWRGEPLRMAWGQAEREDGLVEQAETLVLMERPP